MTPERLHAAGLLVLRLGTSALLLYAHGWHKLSHFSEMVARFADPLGLGRPASLALAVLAEFVCPIAIAAGLFTRLAVVPPLVLLAVVVFVVHRGDPFARVELALVYAVPLFAILLMGGGPWSLDARLRRRGR